MASKSRQKNLYRIMDFSRVVQIFEKEEIYFAKPSTWDDPYEQRIRHAKDHAVFAQCWGERPISDAMWRIYSQNGMGVRISTTVDKLTGVMKVACKAHGYKRRLAKVEYKTQREIDEITRGIAAELRDAFDIGRATDALYNKRDAFSHEAEWRATLFTPEASRDVEKKGVSVRLDPHDFIDRILLDPRAPEELVKAFRFYFKNKLNFKGRIGRSVLYKAPNPYVVEDNAVSVDDL
ncbi:Protein of unknown function [Halopseudomonas litoralis]|uniref:DUF2971 domain-containing protein n=1 Tax=Halopseudomonas litoralis TaxID=797277 RepID=A0A1H1Q600_9GAMM|nr:DUF2971 domain-containing protein [Halopseudomonas litoralis]SDS18697.1 Protein of unknown function [Halopseudomonas litoralis]